MFKFYGMEIEAGSHGMPLDPEMLLVIRMDIVIAALCLWAPIRSCVLWVLPVCAVGIFVLATSAGSADPRGPWGNTVNLCVLCFLS